MRQASIGPDTPVIVVRTDHGMGGMGDARSENVAKYDRAEDALADIAALGYSVTFEGEEPTSYSGSRYHHERGRRHTMGAISYNLVPMREPLPRNHIPEDA